MAPGRECSLKVCAWVKVGVIEASATSGCKDRQRQQPGQGGECKFRACRERFNGSQGVMAHASGTISGCKDSTRHQLVCAESGTPHSSRRPESWVQIARCVCGGAAAAGR